jgi:hypothetical protein
MKSLPIRWRPGYWWYSLKYWIRERPEKITFWLAFHMPRRLAYWAFIRVCAATGEAPYLITFESAAKAWEAGAGKKPKGRRHDGTRGTTEKFVSEQGGANQTGYRLAPTVH